MIRVHFLQFVLSVILRSHERAGVRHVIQIARFIHSLVLTRFLLVEAWRLQVGAGVVAAAPIITIGCITIILSGRIFAHGEHFQLILEGTLLPIEWIAMVRLRIFTTIRFIFMVGTHVRV